jgi:hypothetical protein
VAVKKGFLENKSAIEYTGDSFVASIGIEPPGDLEKLIGS